MDADEHEVVIAGGGPTGLMLAGELALAGVDVVIVEARTDQHVDGSRAGGLHARTLEVLDMRGIAERFIEAGQAMQVTGFAGIPLDISDFPTRHPHGLALFQSAFEPILADWVADELEVQMLRGLEVVGHEQDGDGVDARLSDGRQLRASYLVGCDGGRSLTRRAAGIDFPGWDPTTSWILAEVRMDGDPEYGMRPGAAGTNAIGRAGDGVSARVVLVEREVGAGGAPTLEDLRAALLEVYGSDFGLRSASWISRFTDAARQAATYRRGRVLLAGDAAHVHPPQGGQGLNTGCRTRSTSGGSWRRSSAGRPPPTCSTPTTPSATRSAPASCRTRWPRWRSAVGTTATRRCARPWPSCWRWTSRAAASPGCWRASTSATTSAAGIRWWAGACPTWTCPPRRVRGAWPSSSATPARC